MDDRPSVQLRKMSTQIMFMGKLEGDALKGFWNILIDMAERLEKLQASEALRESGH